VDVRRLERRLADAVLDGTQADVLAVFKEVQDWVNTHSDRPTDDVRCPALTITPAAPSEMTGS
jgi:hypothetical protein